MGNPVMRVRVVKPYQRPYPDPLAVSAGDEVLPDFDRHTDIKGWVWCTAGDGRSGWTPKAWLVQRGEAWRIDRDYDSTELTIEVGEELEVTTEESGFLWVTNTRGESGWVPSENVAEIE
jgi:hypothetical protein